MARTRQERKNDFDEFYNSAKDIFIAFRDQDERALLLPKGSALWFL
ncbi:MAG: hypothetical protein AB7O47_13085 [Flavobacteriales bacterium]